MHHNAYYKIGDKIHNLTIDSIYRISSSNIYYWCKCDCGNLFIAREKDIRNNYITSCGHNNHYNLRTDLSNNKYDELTVIKLDHIEKYKQYYLCKCTCGNYTIVKSDYLTSKNTYKSCGCKSDEPRLANVITHGLSRTRFYNIWQHILHRCDNPNNKMYYLYGGRGITYDPRWKIFENFRDDMYESYLARAKEVGGEQYISIDRIDVNGNYCKENCRWATIYEQANNTRRNIPVIIGNKSYSLANAYEMFHNQSLSYGCVRDRIMKQNIEPITALCLPLYRNNPDKQNNLYSPIRLMNSIQIQKCSELLDQLRHTKLWN